MLDFAVLFTLKVKEKTVSCQIFDMGKCALGLAAKEEYYLVIKVWGDCREADKK